MLEAVGLKRNMDAVDLCCGDGWFTSEMAKIARRVLAIDIDRNMLDVARDRLIKAGTTNCELVEGDAYELTTLAGRLVDFVLHGERLSRRPQSASTSASYTQNVEAGRALCRCQLASCAARGNYNLGRATGTKD